MRTGGKSQNGMASARRGAAATGMIIGMALLVIVAAAGIAGTYGQQATEGSQLKRGGGKNETEQRPRGSAGWMEHERQSGGAGQPPPAPLAPPGGPGRAREEMQCGRGVPTPRENGPTSSGREPSNPAGQTERAAAANGEGGAPPPRWGQEREHQNKYCDDISCAQQRPRQRRREEHDPAKALPKGHGPTTATTAAGPALNPPRFVLARAQGITSGSGIVQQRCREWQKRHERAQQLNKEGETEELVTQAAETMRMLRDEGKKTKSMLIA